MSKLISKSKTSIWAKRAAKLGVLYITVEIIVVVGALVFFGQANRWTLVKFGNNIIRALAG